MYQVFGLWNGSECRFCCVANRGSGLSASDSINIARRRLGLRSESTPLMKNMLRVHICARFGMDFDPKVRLSLYNNGLKTIRVCPRETFNSRHKFQLLIVLCNTFVSHCVDRTLSIVIQIVSLHRVIKTVKQTLLPRS